MSSKKNSILWNVIENVNRSRLVSVGDMVFFLGATDARLGIPGIRRFIAEELKEPAMPGVLYLMVNKDHNKIRWLFHDGVIWWMDIMRIEAGRFVWPGEKVNGKVVSVSDFLRGSVAHKVKVLQSALNAKMRAKMKKVSPSN